MSYRTQEEVVSVALAMIEVNEPLHKWKTFKSDGRFTYRPKQDSRKIAQIILGQCSHPDVIDLVAKEFNSWPERIRIDFRTLASDHQSASGNVRKGLQRLNKMLKGQLIREEFQVTVQKRVETKDGVHYKSVKVNEARAAARRKYGV